MTFPSIDALRASHERLRAIVERLTPDQLRGRAYPSEWSIAQVLSHLGSGAEIGRMQLDAGLTGAGGPDREAFPPVWDRWNAKTPDAQAADGIASDAAHVAAVEANADSTATFPLWFGPTDIEGLAKSRLSEHAVHTWDVAVAVDPAATVSAEAVALILDNVPTLIGFAGKATDWAGVVRVTLTDPARDYALTLGEKVSLEPWADKPADARLALPAEAFLRLVYGRHDDAHMPPLTIEGVEMSTLRTAFPGF
jgi:uncharacterized protein (TIGR03083 family)